MHVSNVHLIAPALKAWRCVLIGSEALLIECAAALQQRGHVIVAVVSDRLDIIEWCAANSVRVLPDTAALMTTEIGAVDYLFSITNLAVLPDAVLALPRAAAINFHDGPLPEHAGLNTPSWALLDGAAEHGVTWHQMTAEVDAGAILEQRRFPLAADETVLTLNRKCFVAGVESFETLIDALAARGPVAITPPSPPRRISLRSDRPAACGAIRWDGPAEQIDRLVRALDFGGYPNPLGTAQASFGGHRLLVAAVTLGSGQSGKPPGTIVEVSPERIVVATATRDLAVKRLLTISGVALSLADAAARLGLRVGARFELIDDGQAGLLSAMNKAVGKHEAWWLKRLTDRPSLDLPGIDRHSFDGAVIEHLDQTLELNDDAARGDTVLVAVAAYLARITDTAKFNLGFSSPVMTAQFAGTSDCFARQVPLGIDCDFAADFDRHRDAVAADVREMHRRIGMSGDLAARMPQLRRSADSEHPLTLPVALLVVDQAEQARAEPGADLTIAVTTDGSVCRWLFDPRRLAARRVLAMQRQFAVLLAAVDRDAATPLADLPLLDADALTEMAARNATAGDWRQGACIHELIAEQARRTPDEVAVTCEDRSLTYGELDRRANRWARHLGSRGVGPETLVGIFVGRSVELVIGVLAVHKAGGAYVPLDPEYPADRIRHMVEDSGVKAILTQSGLAEQLAAFDVDTICLDTGWPSLTDIADEPVDSGVSPENLAYVIYTSGSTGRPKGVMVEHRNVVNFFAGMDDRIEAPGVWLAVTSLSFDISVLELLWTLTRGFHVVIYTGEDRRAAAAPDPHADRGLDFSLFYFASDAAATARDKYRLLIEGAKFGDRAGFSAVWTPERHFHSFGGLYPNPAVTSAAIAAVTDTIQIRAGSVVLPLHHPIRVAEDWSVVDNLSGGRVGISFAAGWQPDDFVLAPEKFKTNKDVMLRDIDVVRRLWRGEAVEFANPLGEIKPIAILPRPVQPELPFWLTSAGNIETFEAAGRMGACVLTHLLGQTIEELTVKLEAYHRAWREAGHTGEGRAALMLHSFVGDDEAAVRATVRGPLIEYLRSSASLIKQYAWSFPAFKRRPGMDSPGGIALDGLDDEEMAALLEHAFERYYETSGLFGTPAACRSMIARLKAAGVDEVACLIDFGIDAETVLAHLPQLDAVRRMAMPVAAATSYDVPTLIARHGVTHLQCTPSLASLLLADERSAAALGAVGTMMVGGEALPPALARELQRLVGGKVMNMYGPTETTIWSTVETLGTVTDPVPLGTPLRNQHVHVLDRRLRPVPDGIPGELVIGGLGVTRGYLHRPGLTAERFVALPGGDGARAYRTGDLARVGPGGSIEFLGRLDNQVKIRGHRIELGEIEAELARYPLVGEAVVVARADPSGDVGLTGYLTVARGVEGVVFAADDLRAHLRERLPEIMCPAQFVTLAALPRTPNGKIDRNALPVAAPVARREPEADFQAPAVGVEEQIAAIWRDVLKLPNVGASDNFFDIGGHSLLAVQLHRALRVSFGQSLSITDIFRFPTIAALGARLAGDGRNAAVSDLGQSRANDRRAALGRRRVAPRGVSETV